MNIISYALYIFTTGVVLLITIALGGKCPQTQYSALIAPCVCENDTWITCSTNESFNIKRTFEYISQSVHWKDRHFERLIINATELHEIPEMAFGDIVFNELQVLNARKLHTIHTNAFGATRLHMKRLSITGADSLTTTTYQYNLFEALSSINNIQALEVTGANLVDIPERAFK
ncbi:unnamed protein product, partial [Oppiella nova]